MLATVKEEPNCYSGFNYNVDKCYCFNSIYWFENLPKIEQNFTIQPQFQEVPLLSDQPNHSVNHSKLNISPPPCMLPIIQSGVVKSKLV